MKLRLSIFAGAATVALFAVATGCGETNDDSPGNTGGTPGAGAPGAGAPGAGAPGAGAGGSPAGSGGGGTGGLNNAGRAGGGSGGLSVGGAGGPGAGTGGTTAGTGGSAAGTGGSIAGTGGSVAGTGGSTAGAGGGSAGGGPAPTFETVKFVIMNGCFGAQCHDLPDHELKLHINDDLHRRMLNHMVVRCNNMPLIVPGNPQGSALIKVLKEPCGMVMRMPPGCEDGTQVECIPPQYIEALEQWITNGAPM